MKLTVGDGGRQASVNSQRIDIDALPVIASEAEALMETASVDPEYMPPVPGGQVYPGIDESWDGFTAGCPPEPRMEAVGSVIDAAAANSYETAGICRMTERKTALATSTGNLGSTAQPMLACPSPWIWAGPPVTGPSAEPAGRNLTWKGPSPGWSARLTGISGRKRWSREATASSLSPRQPGT